MATTKPTGHEVDLTSAVSVFTGTRTTTPHQHAPQVGAPRVCAFCGTPCPDTGSTYVRHGADVCRSCFVETQGDARDRGDTADADERDEASFAAELFSEHGRWY